MFRFFSFFTSDDPEDDYIDGSVADDVVVDDKDSAFYMNNNNITKSAADPPLNTQHYQYEPEAVTALMQALRVKDEQLIQLENAHEYAIQQLRNEYQKRIDELRYDHPSTTSTSSPSSSSSPATVREGDKTVEVISVKDTNEVIQVYNQLRHDYGELQNAYIQLENTYRDAMKELATREVSNSPISTHNPNEVDSTHQVDTTRLLEEERNKIKTEYEALLESQQAALQKDFEIKLNELNATALSNSTDASSKQELLEQWQSERANWEMISVQWEKELNDLRLQNEELRAQLNSISNSNNDNSDSENKVDKQELINLQSENNTIIYQLKEDISTWESRFNELERSYTTLQDVNAKQKVELEQMSKTIEEKLGMVKRILQKKDSTISDLKMKLQSVASSPSTHSTPSTPYTTSYSSQYQQYQNPPQPQQPNYHPHNQMPMMASPTNSPMNWNQYPPSHPQM